jgi:glycosyltransferase involved in cell wall biosynthesis
MKIGIDARMMGAQATRGIGRYIHELIGAFLVVAPENEYTLIVSQTEHDFRKSPNVRTIVSPIPWYGLEEQRKMPAVLSSLGTDVIHVPHWNVPLSYSGPLIVTIHDLLLRHQPKSAKASTRAWPIRAIKQLGFRLVLDHTVKAARRICVPTEFVRQDLEHLYPKAMGKVVVTGEGVTSFDVKRITQNVNLDEGSVDEGRFLLYVGSAYPHKRLDLLLDAWAELSRLDSGLELVLAGEMDVFMQKLKAMSKERNLPRVRFLGRVTDQELSGLYQEASSLVFPSDFEGFGLPPLEALVQGCPVVSSDAGPMPEVLGKKGVIYFKSGSRGGMLQAIRTVVDNPDFYRKQALQAGPELAARHSWQEAAVKTLQAYGSAVLG